MDFLQRLLVGLMLQVFGRQPGLPQRKASYPETLGLRSVVGGIEFLLVRVHGGHRHW